MIVKDIERHERAEALTCFLILPGSSEEVAKEKWEPDGSAIRWKLKLYNYNFISGSSTQSQKNSFFFFFCIADLSIQML